VVARAAVAAVSAPWLRTGLRLGRAIAFPAAVVLVAVMATRAVGKLDFSRIEIAPLLLALVPLTVWWLLLARAWALVHSGKVLRSDLRTWCRTQALRYLPGGVWAPVSRAVAVEGRMLDRVSTVAAENVVALCAALAVGGLALGVSRDARWLAVLVVAVVPAALAGFTSRMSRLDRARLSRATANDVVAFAAYAGAAVLIQVAVSGAHAPLAVAGAAAIAWAAGLVVVVTPGGIGVREVVYVSLLAGAGITHSALVGAAVAGRMLTILVELAVLLVLGRAAHPEHAQDVHSIGRVPCSTKAPPAGDIPGEEAQLADRDTGR
jgi:glycosyltransferase 2 family protein